jgi:hypothetical protein
MLLIGCMNPTYIHKELINTSTCITRKFNVDTTKVCGGSCEKCPSQSYNEYDNLGYRIIQVYQKKVIVNDCDCSTEVYVLQKSL